MSNTLNHVLSDPNWAADRIDELEAALAEIANHKPEIGTAKIRAMARAALTMETTR